MRVDGHEAVDEAVPAHQLEVPDQPQVVAHQAQNVAVQKHPVRPKEKQTINCLEPQKMDSFINGQLQPHQI